ncbi:MAG: cysteine--tRNA ligase [Candidatus Aenigmatarchaeota archaeon]
MGIKFYNTMSGKKEDFEPIEEGNVRMYTCGQTIYDDLHIGNARTYAYWDILKKYLKWKGFDVFHVQNITDVGHLTSKGQDKIEKRAKEKGKEPMVLVEEQLEKYYRDMRDLNIERHDINPRATGHIMEIIDMVKKIIENGYGYEVNGSVYLDIERFNKDYDYAKMSGMNIEDLKVGARIEKKQEKKNPLDFALWIKAPEEHIMKWNSPWSVGYPGWHIECSVMSTKYLGKKFDIHGGGKDHIFPHHPNERAQCLAANDIDFVNYWLHTNFLSINEEKMSKSKGNFFTAREMIDKYGGEVLRLFFASSHYRKEVNFSEKNIENARNNLERIYNTMELVKRSDGGNKENIKEEIEVVKKRFEEVMDDNLDTPKAVDLLLNFSKKINKSLDNKPDILQKSVETLKELGSILGLKLESENDRKDFSKDLIELLIETREKLREEENYQLSDQIRSKLKKLGIILEDKDGTIEWKYSNLK